jgi:hypothetical protein
MVVLSIGQIEYNAAFSLQVE